MTDKELVDRYTWLFDNTPSQKKLKELGGTEKHEGHYREWLDGLGFEPPTKNSFTILALKGRKIIAWGNPKRIALITGEPNYHEVIRMARKNYVRGTRTVNQRGYVLIKIDEKKLYKYLYRKDFWELFEPLKDW